MARRAASAARPDQEAAGEGDGPGEELQDERGPGFFSGADEAEDLLDVVGDGCDYAVLAVLGGLEDLQVTVVRPPVVAGRGHDGRRGGGQR